MEAPLAEMSSNFLTGRRGDSTGVLGLGAEGLGDEEGWGCACFQEGGCSLCRALETHLGSKNDHMGHDVKKKTQNILGWMQVPQGGDPLAAQNLA